MKVINLTEQLPDEDVERLIGNFLDDSHYDILIQEDADIYKPDGQPLVKFRKGVIPAEMCRDTVAIWAGAATTTDNRGDAAGAPQIDEEGNLIGLRKESGKVVEHGKQLEAGKKRFKFVKKDGTVSKKTVAQTVKSGIVGFMDKNTRFPYCRLTAFNARHMDKFNECMPMITMVDHLFALYLPDRHKAQMEYHSRTSEDFKIPGTSFTTITCNDTFRTASHRDKGDLKEGFGVMTAIRSGRFKGGFLVFPKYRIAVDMDTTDLICADVHEVHGNTEMKGIPGTFKRISLVFYYRERIATCGTAEEERQKAIARTEGYYQRQGEFFDGAAANEP